MTNTTEYTVDGLLQAIAEARNTRIEDVHSALDAIEARARELSGQAGTKPVNQPISQLVPLRALVAKLKVPPTTLMDEPLIKYAHRMLIEACGAWSDVKNNDGTLDEAKCQYAAAQEGYLRGAIDQIFTLAMNHADELESALNAIEQRGAIEPQERGNG